MTLVEQTRDVRFEAMEHEIALIAEQDLPFEAKLMQMTLLRNTGSAYYDLPRAISAFIYEALTAEVPTTNQVQVEGLRNEWREWCKPESSKRRNWAVPQDSDTLNRYVGKKATAFALSAYNALVGGTDGYNFPYAAPRRGL